MKFVATFEHGRKQWCVQLIEQGPCPIVMWCGSEEEAKTKAQHCQEAFGLFSDPVNHCWVNMASHNAVKQTPDSAGFGDRMDN